MYVEQGLMHGIKWDFQLFVLSPSGRHSTRFEMVCQHKGKEKSARLDDWATTSSWNIFYNRSWQWGSRFITQTRCSANHAKLTTVQRRRARYTHTNTHTQCTREMWKMELCLSVYKDTDIVVAAGHYGVVSGRGRVKTKKHDETMSWCRPQSRHKTKTIHQWWQFRTLLQDYNRTLDVFAGRGSH